MVILMSNQINRIALSAARDSRLREVLINDNEQTILKTASSVSHRYVTKSDDEWSVALGAFSKAIDVYKTEKGDFLPFAKMIIKRDLVDHYRKTSSGVAEIPIAPGIMEGDRYSEEDSDGVYLTLVEKSKESADTSMKDEIISANEMLKDYGFRFYDLTECSPQQDKTRKECGSAIRYMLEHEELTEELERTRKLPIKALNLGSGVSRKTLDRYRKYIIMAVLILKGDYPHIAQYLKYVRKEAL